jgi:succinate dehydrogenase / fumarate reductase flavoprotein subunit
MGNYIAQNKLDKVDPNAPEVAEAESEVKSRIGRLLAINGKKSVTYFHRS